MVVVALAVVLVLGSVLVVVLLDVEVLSVVLMEVLGIEVVGFSVLTITPHTLRSLVKVIVSIARSPV